MNEYAYSDLKIGQKEHFSVIVSEEMMTKFVSITGDINPLHSDSEFAKNMGYSGKVVYGMLTSAMLSTLAGVYLPGKYSLIHQVETKLLRPVYVGDELNIEGQVKELHDSVEQATIKVLIINSRKEKVLRGTIKVGFLHEQ